MAYLGGVGKSGSETTIYLPDLSAEKKNEHCAKTPLTRIGGRERKYVQVNAKKGKGVV